jgi:RNA recognition motif-containing protein
MPDSSAAERAINELNGREVQGRNLKIGEARPQKERRPRY